MKNPGDLKAKRHDMLEHTQTYEKTYGYGHRYRLTCSCGLDTGWSAGKFDQSIHRQQVIQAHLGLLFSIGRGENERV